MNEVAVVPLPGVTLPADSVIECAALLQPAASTTGAAASSPAVIARVRNRRRVIRLPPDWAPRI